MPSNHKTEVSKGLSPQGKDPFSFLYLCTKKRCARLADTPFLNSVIGTLPAQRQRKFCLLCAGTRKNPERRRENQESGKALAPLRFARPSCHSKSNPRNFQGYTKQNQRIISCFPAGDRMRGDVRYKRKQAPEPDGGGACVWILNLSLCSSVNALYHSNIEKNISQYVTINCNFYKCTFKIGVVVIQRNKNLPFW